MEVEGEGEGMLCGERGEMGQGEGEWWVDGDDSGDDGLEGGGRVVIGGVRCGAV